MSRAGRAGLIAAAALLALATGGASRADGDRPGGGGGVPGGPAAPPTKGSDGAGSGAPGATTADGAPTQVEVDRAVARGIKFLRDQQQDDGGFGTTAGEAGLALWAMRHCGVPKDDKAVLRAAERIVRDIPQGDTYDNSLGICGLLAHDAVAHKERIQKALDELVKGQCDSGQWSYKCNRAGRNVGDNSNTQCAALALGAARLRAFKVPAPTTQRLLDFTVKTQNADGGWGYAERQNADSYGGMTAGMLMSWALASASLVGVQPRKVPLRDDPVAQKAINWLGGRFEPGHNPANTDFVIYWLWSVERADAMLGFDRLGKHDWYAEGARWLLSHQTDKGGWTDERTVPDTCWALLFLRRGTITVITPRDGEIPAPVTTPK